MAIAAPLMTAEEFAATPDTDSLTELVRGRIVESPLPDLSHGLVCTEMAFLLGTESRRSKGVTTLRVGVVTRRNPDSVRGPDLVYFQASRVPLVERRGTYLEIPPDLIVEVKSFTDRWLNLLVKTAEYLNFGVPTVLLLDPDTRSAYVFWADQAPRIFGPEDTLILPELLGDFAVVVGQIFE